jgi:hypothetical protein
MLDRPGHHGSLEKPDPYTYVCSACHDEVLEDTPPDLAPQVERWSPEARRDRTIHRALSRTEKLRAIKEVHPRLAGLANEMPAPAASRVKESPVLSRAQRLFSPVAASDIAVPTESAGPLEVAYTDLLFDFRSVRSSW